MGKQSLRERCESYLSLFFATKPEDRHHIIDFMLETELYQALTVGKYHASNISAKTPKQQLNTQTYSEILAASSIKKESFVLNRILVKYPEYVEKLKAVFPDIQGVVAVKVLRVWMANIPADINNKFAPYNPTEKAGLLVGLIVGSLLKTENGVTTIPDHVYAIIPKLLELITDEDEKMKAITEIIKAIRCVSDDKQGHVINAIIKSKCASVTKMSDAIGEGYKAILQKRLDDSFEGVNDNGNKKDIENFNKEPRRKQRGIRNATQKSLS